MHQAFDVNIQLHTPPKEAGWVVVGSHKPLDVAAGGSIPICSQPPGGDWDL